jgi:hypothetical protein
MRSLKRNSRKRSTKSPKSKNKSQSRKRSRTSPKRLLEIRQRNLQKLVSKSPKSINLAQFEKRQVLLPKSGSDTKPRNTFTILDNGGEPFVVDIYSNYLEVYLQILDEEKSNRRNKEVYIRGKKILSTPFVKLFVGNNYFRLERYGSKKGNSILVQVKGDEYIYIGSEIYQFQARDGDQILVYASPVGNSAVPYPYAIGENYVYYMLYKSTLPIELLHDPTLGYEEMYQRFYKPDQTTKFKFKMIQGRVF